MQRNKLNFRSVNSFYMNISYLDIDASNPGNIHDHHTHNKCEIYINLSGDVSFSVENAIYPIMPGNIIITRPYEYHHCIYHSDKNHKHFCILFDSDGNEELFDAFFKREIGKNNLIILTPEKLSEVTAVCHSLNENPVKCSRKFYLFSN